MSRPIAESVSLLSETLTNCKTNLKDKGVESETIKISDVDEKIAEIQAGGGSSDYSGLYNDVIEKVEVSQAGKNDYRTVKFFETTDCVDFSSGKIDVKVTVKSFTHLYLIYDLGSVKSVEKYPDNNVIDFTDIDMDTYRTSYPYILVDDFGETVFVFIILTPYLG